MIIPTPGGQAHGKKLAIYVLDLTIITQVVTRYEIVENPDILIVILTGFASQGPIIQQLELLVDLQDILEFLYRLLLAY